MQAEETIKAIDALRTVLGTMVIVPTEETDPGSFKKVVTGSVQRPIIEGTSRDIVKNQLLNLVDKLDSYD